MKLEPDTKKPIPPIPASSFTRGTDVDSSLKPTGASKKMPFLWKDCASSIERDRVDIKQQAVLDGLRLAGRLSSILRNQIGGKNQGSGADELEDWKEKFDKVKEQYEAPHSTVGLIGALGSGKSTLLNALLGEKDLLPSSNDRAGTAAACKVVFNHGPEGYRAQVLFRSRQSFTDDLDKLFKSLKLKRELQAMMEEDPAAAEEEEIEDQLDDIEANTCETLETLLVLFGVEEEDLDVTSTEKFLEAHPLGVLGTIIEITETDRETFVSKTKPFMDSTPAEHDGQELMLWPLIEHVTIFVKSDILKYGLALVDLPGLGDAVESRSRVAERFSQKLDITAVVAPVIRATEEKAVMGYIKRRQEDEMRMNGKFDRDSLCIVVSKSEDMDLNGYLGRKRITKDYPNIPGLLARARTLDKAVRKSEVGLGGSEHETLENRFATTASHDDQMEANRKEFLDLGESLKHAAVSIRNRVVIERMQKQFQVRKAAVKSPKDNQFYADAVEVFPTSARAFQELQHPGGWKESGFPTERHTGVPRFKQWLFEVTFKKREKHLDATLTQLSSLFVQVQTWIFVNEDALAMPTIGLHGIDSIHERHLRSLTALLRQCGDELRGIEPLKARGAATAACQSKYPGMIDRWRYRYPDKTKSYLKLPGITKKCILRKNGDYHQSKGKYPYEYQWVDDLAAVFINEVVNDWKHTFLQVVPSYDIKIQELLEHVWQRYMIALNDFCCKHSASHLRDTGKVQQVIENAEAHLALGAHRTLLSFRIGAQCIHPLFRQEIQKIMTPVFQEAYLTRGGGCMRKRDDLLKQFAADQSADMPVKACETMEAALAELIQEQVEDLEGLAADAVSTVERHMRLLLGINKAPVSPTTITNQKMLAAEISPHLKVWKLCWLKPSSKREDHVMRGDLSIPEPDLIKVKRDEDGV